LRGFQPTLDAELQIDLLHRPQNGGDHLLATTTVSDTLANVDGGFPGDFDTQLSAPALTPSCGDSLVLRIKILSGNSPYSDLNPILTTP
jgi:hypothetical protein